MPTGAAGNALAAPVLRDRRGLADVMDLVPVKGIVHDPAQRPVMAGNPAEFRGFRPGGPHAPMP